MRVGFYVFSPGECLSGLPDYIVFNKLQARCQGADNESAGYSKGQRFSVVYPLPL